MVLYGKWNFGILTKPMGSLIYNLSKTFLLLIYSIEQLSDGFEASIVYSYTLTLLSLVLEDEKGHFVINRPGL